MIICSHEKLLQLKIIRANNFRRQSKETIKVTESLGVMIDETLTLDEQVTL